MSSMEEKCIHIFYCVNSYLCMRSLQIASSIDMLLEESTIPNNIVLISMPYKLSKIIVYQQYLETEQLT